MSGNRMKQILATGAMVTQMAAFALGVELDESPPMAPPAMPCAWERTSLARSYAPTPYIYPHSGEAVVEAVDLRIPGRGLDFVWARKYRSRISPDTAMGNGWDFSYNIWLEADGADRILHDGNSRADRYLSYDTNLWAADRFFRALAKNGDGTYSVVFPDRGVWLFHPLNGSPTAGKVFLIKDRNGNALTINYDGTGRLTSVVDTLGRTITIGYNAQGFISSVTDYSGRQVTFTYYIDAEVGGSLGDLKSATSPAVVGTPNGNDFPSGKTVTYAYTEGFADDALNHNLLTITDAKGQTILTNSYSGVLDPLALVYDRCTRQVWGDPGDIIDYVYFSVLPVPENNFAVLKAIVNDRVGNVKELHYDAENLLVVLREFTGRADPDIPTSETMNRPTGKLRPDDPDFFETQFEYNVDACMTRIDLPRGNSTEYVYERDIDPEAFIRARGHLREMHRLPGALGGDQPELVELFEYDFAANGATNFVTRWVDARNSETNYQYDSAGNRTHADHRIPSIVQDWEYNVFGQLTAYIHPDNGGGHRRRDEFTYYDDGQQQGYLHQAMVDVGDFSLTSSYEYDAVGNITRVTDPKGNDTQRIVNSLNQVVRVVSRAVDLPDGSGTVRYERDFFYDLNNNTGRIDVQNINVDGVLDANAYLTTINEFGTLNESLGTCRESGAFDVPAGQFSCDGLAESDFITNDYEYDANRNRSLVRTGEAAEGRQPDAVVRTHYDERDLRFQVVRGEGGPDQSTSQYDYNENGGLKRTVVGLEDAAPREFLKSRDGYERLAEATDPMGNITTNHYDANGNQISKRIDGELDDMPGSTGNIRLGEETAEFDAMDRRTHRTAQFFDMLTQLPIGDGSAVTNTVYSDTSQVLADTDDNGHTTSTAYDTAQRRALSTDARGNSRSYGYDGNSNLFLTTDVDKSDLGAPDEVFVTTYDYDGIDRQIKKVDNIGNAWSTAYDSRNNRRRSVDALENLVEYDYDGLDRLLVTTRYLTDTGTGDGTVIDSIVTAQAWDDNSRLTSQADDNGNATSYVYDGLNRRISTVYADGTVDSRIYDVHGNAIEATDANGSVVTNSYDLRNRLTMRVVTLGEGVSDDTTFQLYAYDGRSRSIGLEDDDSSVVRAYDSLSNRLSETLTIATASGTTTGSVNAAYDGEGNKLTCAYPGGRQIAMEYDELDRLKEIEEFAEQPVVVYYDIGSRRVEQRDYGNNTRTTYDYDGLRRIIGTTHVFDPHGIPLIIDERIYGWDPMSNKTQRSEITPGGPQIAHEYEYESAYRLVNTTVTDVTDDPSLVRDTTYTLDGVGNRLSVVGAPDDGEYVGPYALDPATPTPADFQMNQYTATPADAREYDCEGNLIKIIPAAPFCDGDANGDGIRNPLDAGFVQARFGCAVGTGDSDCDAADVNDDGQTDPLDVGYVLARFGSCPASAGVTTIAYDYSDRMVEFIDGDSGQRHIYAYDASRRRIAKVVDADGAAEEVRYFYDGNRVCEEQDGSGQTAATYVYGRYVDEILQMQRDGLDRYYHADDLYSVMAVSDTAGIVIERYEHGDYGQPLAPGTLAPITRNPSSIGNPYLFTGRNYDSETALSWYRTRYLDPCGGRFTTRDRIGIWGSQLGLGNAYSLVGNSPATYVDPTGQDGWVEGYYSEVVWQSIADSAGLIFGESLLGAAGEVKPGLIVAAGVFTYGGFYLKNYYDWLTLDAEDIKQECEQLAEEAAAYCLSLGYGQCCVDYDYEMIVHKCEVAGGVDELHGLHQTMSASYCFTEMVIDYPPEAHGGKPGPPGDTPRKLTLEMDEVDDGYEHDDDGHYESDDIDCYYVSTGYDENGEPTGAYTCSYDAQ